MPIHRTPADPPFSPSWMPELELSGESQQQRGELSKGVSLSNWVGGEGSLCFLSHLSPPHRPPQPPSCWLAPGPEFLVEHQIRKGKSRRTGMEEGVPGKTSQKEFHGMT